MADIDWWRFRDDVLAAVLPVHGNFVLPSGSSEWKWRSWGSDGWDLLHQEIYRQHRATRLDGPPPDAPPLPEPPPPEERPDPDDPGELAQDPRLIGWVGSGRVAFAALVEDPYETTFGDGLFRDFAACYPTEEQAVGHPISGGLEGHVRRIQLRVEDGRVRAVGERRDYADRYTMEKVLADLVARL